MGLSREEVEHVAYLARLGVSDDVLEQYAQQLSTILEHVQDLSRLDTSDIAPTAQVIALRNVMRDDVVRPSLCLDEVLANAPQHENGQFRVQVVLEEP